MTELVEQSKEIWAPDPRCTVCGERMAWFQRHIMDGVYTGWCTTCHATEDKPRFCEIQPVTRPKNVRRDVRLEHIAENRYQAIWEE